MRLLVRRASGMCVEERTAFLRATEESLSSQHALRIHQFSPLGNEQGSIAPISLSPPRDLVSDDRWFRLPDNQQKQRWLRYREPCAKRDVRRARRSSSPKH